MHRYIEAEGPENCKKIQKWKVFQDSVHGPMEFHPLIVRIIDTREFQRLRHIKQLGMTYWVFPAASHTRFEHSLGVCHLAGLLIEKLIKNSDPNICKVSDEEKLCVQIAALCHDVGHGPFSHTWEGFLRRFGKDWHHELASCEMFDLLLSENRGALREAFRKNKLELEHEALIKDLIIGDSKRIKDKSKSFLFQIVANKFNEVDVDKWDYFLRDGQNLNLNISFDYRRTMALCRVNTWGNSKAGETTIAFRDNEAMSIDNMFRLRGDLYARAYMHRVAMCLDLMICDAFVAADGKYKVLVPDSERKVFTLSDAHEDMRAFRKLTDHIQVEIENSVTEDLKPARDILARIANRNLYDIVEEWVLCKDTGGMGPQDFKSLEKRVGGDFAFSQIDLRMKDPKPHDNIFYFSKDEPANRVKTRSFPNVDSDLPKYYQLLVFCRNPNITNFESVKKEVEAYLIENVKIK